MGRGPFRCDAGVRARGGDGQLHQGRADPAHGQDHRHAAGAAPGGAAAREAAAPHDAQGGRHARRGRVLRARGASAGRAGRRGNQPVGRNGPAARPPAGGCAQPVRPPDPRAGHARIPCALPRHSNRSGRERPPGGPHRRPCGLRGARRHHHRRIARRAPCRGSAAGRLCIARLPAAHGHTGPSAGAGGLAPPHRRLSVATHRQAVAACAAARRRARAATGAPRAVGG